MPRWLYGSDSIPQPGELFTEGASVHVHTTDADGIDQADLLDALEPGDRFNLSAGTSLALEVDITEVEPAPQVPGVVSMHGTVIASPLWPPPAGSDITARRIAAPPPPPPPPPAPPGRAMTTEVFKISKGQVGFSLTDPGKAIDAAAIGDYTDFSCVVTRGLVTASANFDTAEVPGTMCDPAAETVTPSAPTFELVLEVLQDPQLEVAAPGLAAFLWAHDSGVTGSPVWFYLGLADGTAPKIIGQCYLSPMDFGGTPREVLTASLTLPIEGRPTPQFGTAAPTP